MRLDDKVHFECASATNTGLPTGAYDLVWMQNAAMNIEDRSALYSEIRRLLRPAGCYVFQEVLGGDGGPAYFPIHWATTADESFLQSPETVLKLLLESGFRVLYWEDETEATSEERRQRNETVILGEGVPSYLPAEKRSEAALNSNRSNDEGRVRYGRGLFQKL